MNANPNALSRQNFTLIEMLVVIGIVAILASILMPSLGSAMDSSTRTQINARVKSLIHLNSYRITGRQVGDWTLFTFPEPTADNETFALFQGPNGNVDTLNDNSKWTTVDPTLPNIPKSLQSMQAFDPVHPLDEQNGYFIFCSSVYAAVIDDFSSYRKVWMDDRRKIAIDVYDYQNEGDGKVSVGFADGHVAAEDTALRGLADSRGVLISTTAHSYEPGFLSNDL